MNSLYGNLKDVIMMTWPMLFISLVILVSVRISFLIKHKEEFILYKEITLLLFVLYILCLFQIVTAQDVNIYEGNNFIPFTEIFRYEIGSKYFIKNIIGNVIMFMPYGFFVGKFASLKNTKLTIFLLLLASISIEVTQLLIGRVFDVDDIILNIIGSVGGYLIYVILSAIDHKLPDFTKKVWFRNILVIIFIAAIIFLYYNVGLWGIIR